MAKMSCIPKLYKLSESLSNWMLGGELRKLPPKLTRYILSNHCVVMRLLDCRDSAKVLRDDITTHQNCEGRSDKNRLSHDQTGGISKRRESEASSQEPASCYVQRTFCRSLPSVHFPDIVFGMNAASVMKKRRPKVA
jgi:hypothetical protein